jgi:hypothetical protein
VIDAGMLKDVMMDVLFRSGGGGSDLVFVLLGREIIQPPWK